MKTISDRVREAKLRVKEEPVVVEVYDEISDTKPVEVEVYEEEFVEKISKEIKLEGMTKDQLNDYASKLGFDKEVKGWWSKKRIITTLKGLVGN